MTDKFMQEIIKECKKQGVPFNYYSEGWTAAITQIICATAALVSLVTLIVVVSGGCK